MQYLNTKSSVSQDKADSFNDFFFSSFNNKKYSLPDIIGHQNDNLNNFYVTESEVLAILENIDTNKATGPDNLSGTILKGCAPSITESLEWKHANIVPIFKKGDKT